MFCFENPLNFGVYNEEVGSTMPITKLSAHALEIIEENVKYNITTCGWTDKPVSYKGCVSIAPLDWK